MAAAGLNKAMLIGHVSCAPKSNVTKGKVGVRQAIFILATTEEWFDKATNQRRHRTITHRIVVYGPLVNVVERCVRQGARVYVEGNIETRRWMANGAPTESWTVEIIVQVPSGRLTVLDFANGEPAWATEESLDEEPAPLSIKRSTAKYGDDAGLQRYLMPDDQDRSRHRQD